ncbi:MAG: hypothetical protein HEEMFOPI_00508 [Holosporales bacterium]
MKKKTLLALLLLPIFLKAAQQPRPTINFSPDLDSGTSVMNFLQRVAPNQVVSSRAPSGGVPDRVALSQVALSRLEPRGGVSAQVRPNHICLPSNAFLGLETKMEGVYERLRRLEFARCKEQYDASFLDKNEEDIRVLKDELGVLRTSYFLLSECVRKNAAILNSHSHAFETFVNGEITRVEGFTKELVKKIKSLEQLVLSLERGVKDQEPISEALNEKIERLEQLVLSLERGVKDQEPISEALNEKTKRLEQLISSLASSSESSLELLKRKQDAGQTLINSKISEVASMLTETENQIRQLSKSVEEIQKVDVAKLSSLSDKNATSIEAVMNKVELLEREVVGLKRDNKQFQKDKIELEAMCQKLESENKKLQTDVANLKQFRENALSKMSSMNEKWHREKDSLEELKKQVSLLNVFMGSLKQKPKKRGRTFSSEPVLDALPVLEADIPSTSEPSATAPASNASSTTEPSITVPETDVSPTPVPDALPALEADVPSASVPVPLESFVPRLTFLQEQVARLKGLQKKIEEKRPFTETESGFWAENLQNIKNMLKPGIDKLKFYMEEGDAPQDYHALLSIIDLLKYELYRQNGFQNMFRIFRSNIFNSEKDGFFVLAILNMLNPNNMRNLFNFEKEEDQISFLTSFLGFFQQLDVFLTGIQQSDKKFFCWKFATYICKYEVYMQETIPESDRRDNLVKSIFISLCQNDFSRSRLEKLPLEKIKVKFVTYFPPIKSNPFFDIFIR